MSKNTKETSASAHEGLISRKQLKELIPVSSMTIWRWEREGRLPKHVTIGRTSFWHLHEIRAVIESAQ